LAGRQVDLGTFRSFVAHNDLSTDVTIGVTIEGLIDESIVRRLQMLGARRAKNVFVPPNSQTRRVPYSLRSRFRFGVVKGRDVPYLKLAHFEMIFAGKRFLDWRVTAVPTATEQPFDDVRYRLVLPVNYFRFVGLEMMDVDVDKDDPYVQLDTVIKGLLPQGIRARSKYGPVVKQKAGTKTRRRYSTWPLPHPIGAALDDLQTALANIHYLGPLRSAAERFYVAQSGSDPGMDSAGAFLPYVLRDRGDTMVRSCPPGSDAFIETSLHDALDAWLSYLRTGRIPSRRSARHEINSETTKGVLVELNIRSVGGRESHALADSGFGYSQVLPILVGGLLASPGTTLIVEQPELHLNPALQVRLAEFFVGMARCGKQVILETHSEHVLNGMRVLAAESEESIACAVYFLDTAMGRPRVHRLSVASDGTVADWPPEFFGEATDLRARLLRAQRRFLGSEREPE
jgi:hypothetical protein